MMDISEQFNDKIRAIRCYASQFMENPNNRFVFDYIEMQNRYLGMLIRTEYAEAIYAKEAIKISNLSDLL